MVEDRSMHAVLSEALAEPDKPASYSAVTKDYRSTVTAMNNLLDKSDDPTLIAMGRKPYALRALKIGPEIRRLDAEMMNRPTPEFEQALEDAFAKVIARFEATASAKPE